MHISVAMTMYAGASYVEEQMRSILDQSRPADELVLGDDQPGDGTGAVARRVLQGAAVPTVFLDHEVRGGVLRNVDSCLRRTSGDLVALSDQDDRWHPDKLATMSQYFVDPDVTAVFSDARLVDAQGCPLPGTLWQRIGYVPRPADGRSSLELDELLRANVVTGATLVVRRSVVERALPLPRHHHDHWLAMVAAATGTVIAEARPLMDYRLHDANLAGLRGASMAGRLRATAQAAGRSRAKADLLRLLVKRAGAEMPAGRSDHVEQWAAFLDRRAALPARRLRRLPAVRQLLSSGDYARFARGRAAAIGDMLVPASRFSSASPVTDDW